MGNTCKPMAVSFQCMTKFTTNKKNKKIYNKALKKQKKNPVLKSSFVHTYVHTHTHPHTPTNWGGLRPCDY